MPLPNVSSVTRRMWKAIRRRPDWKVSAFVAHCQERGVPMDKTAVSKMMSGQRVTSSDTLWMLAEYFVDPDLVYGPFLAMLDDEDELDLAEDFDADAASRSLVQLAARQLEAVAAGDTEALLAAAHEIQQLTALLTAYANRDA